VIKNNIERKHLTPFQKVELAQHLIEIERELAKQRQIEAGKVYGKGKNSLPSKESKLSMCEVTEIVAPKIGMSKSTLERALVVTNEADEENKKEIC